MDRVFTDAILRWWDLNRRDLPWRHTQDPYAVWLSEVILQQTRIVQGTAYWHRFMERFPTVEDLAQASEDEVLRLWEGLGYYSRARNLHAAARQVAAAGSFPDTLEGIRSLKGVGDYTAAAIGSICFGLPAAVVDGNVYRVLARYFGVETPIGTGAAKKEFTALAQSLLPEDAGAFNQALMDFGALQCSPAALACDSCPLQRDCNAFTTGRTSLLPVKKAAAAPVERHLCWIYITCDGETAVRRRGDGDIWQGLWEPYSLENRQPDLPGCTLLKQKVKHQLTHRTILADFYLAKLDNKPDLPEGYVWIAESQLDRYGKPRLFERLLEAVRAYNQSKL